MNGWATIPIFYTIYFYNIVVTYDIVQFYLGMAYVFIYLIAFVANPVHYTILYT